MREDRSYICLRTHILVRSRADQTANQAADKTSNESCAAFMMLNVVNDVMPRGRATMMNWCRTAMTSVMGRGNRRACGQGRSCEKNHNGFDDLVHITPATFCLTCFAGDRLPLTES